MFRSEVGNGSSFFKFLLPKSPFLHPYGVYRGFKRVAWQLHRMETDASDCGSSKIDWKYSEWKTIYLTRGITPINGKEYQIHLEYLIAVM
jgi:hypothetical protein